MLEQKFVASYLSVPTVSSAQVAFEPPPLEPPPFAVPPPLCEPPPFAVPPPLCEPPPFEPPPVPPEPLLPRQATAAANAKKPTVMMMERIGGRFLSRLAPAI